MWNNYRETNKKPLNIFTHVREMLFLFLLSVISDAFVMLKINSLFISIILRSKLNGKVFLRTFFFLFCFCSHQPSCTSVRSGHVEKGREEKSSRLGECDVWGGYSQFRGQRPEQTLLKLKNWKSQPGSLPSDLQEH